MKGIKRRWKCSGVMRSSHNLFSFVESWEEFGNDPIRNNLLVRLDAHIWLVQLQNFLSKLPHVTFLKLPRKQYLPVNCYVITKCNNSKCNNSNVLCYCYLKKLLLLNDTCYFVTAHYLVVLKQFLLPIFAFLLATFISSSTFPNIVVHFKFKFYIFMISSVIALCAALCMFTGTCLSAVFLFCMRPLDWE